MMGLIRSIIYRLGFRPKLGSIFFSPSWVSPEAHKKIMDAFDRGFESVDRTPPSQYQNMNFCIVCGARLVLRVLDIKECPNLHGKVFTTHNSKGLPAIMFEPEESYQK